MSETNAQTDLKTYDNSALEPHISAETAHQLLSGDLQGGYGLPVTELRTSVHDAAQIAAMVDKPK